MTFDYCIIDEASQAVEPALLGPLLKAKKFVLFGDYDQLQPIIHSKEASEEGMSVSLFERLGRKHESSVSKLTIQVNCFYGLALMMYSIE